MFAILLLAFPTYVEAQDYSRQEYRKFELIFEKNKVFYQQLNTSVSQIIKIMGEDVVQKQDSTFYFKWTPIKHEGEKWVLISEIEGVKMSIDISGNKIEYDSTRADADETAANPGLMGFFKKLIGVKFTVTLNKSFKVEKVEGVKEFLSNLAAESSQMEAILKSIMTDDAVKQMLDPAMGMLSDSPKKPGEKWKHEVVSNLGPIGSYRLTYNLTYVGPDQGLDKLEVETSLVYSPPKDDPPSNQLLFRIKDGKLMSQPSPKGVAKYNPILHRIESVDIEIRIKGDLTVTIGNVDTIVELLQTQKTSFKSSDTSFLQPPKTIASPDSSVPLVIEPVPAPFVTCQPLICQPTNCRPVHRLPLLHSHRLCFAR